jgi:membrane protease YdiL (CAAX protease family)
LIGTITRTSNDATRLLAVINMGLIAIAEATITFWGIIPGVIFHAVILIGLINLYIFMDQLPHREVFLALTLPPLLRILSLTIPIPQLPQIYWYAAIGLPMLLAIAWMNRGSKPMWMGSKLDRHGWLIQILIALTGIPFGAAAYWILKPKPIMSGSGWPGILLGAAILTVFGGYTEELVYRGTLQPAIQRAFGPSGLWISSALYACMYIGSLSWGFVILAALTGLFFGFLMNRTNSILGVAAAHSLLNIGLILVWPLLL